ncbi:major facilitator superfamily domain-containing protein [Linnemannia elongata]|nr:major facilitator superfamily domain-containing protein [Linnemannia elongata]
MDDSHLHASSSASNGQHPQEADNNNDTNTENSNTSHNSTLNNNKSNTRRLKNGTSLGRLHTQGLSSLRPGGSLAPPPAAAAAAGGSSGEYLRADGHVVNPNKLRPTTSALTTSICSTIEPSDCAAFNWVTRIIYRHYSRVDYVRTEAQLDREAYLIGNIRFSRWIFLPAAFCFQAVCGTLYAWSVFNNLIDTALYGPATNTHLAAITFYVALGCFGVSSSIMGPWLERNGPRKAGLLGAVLFLIGNLITALGVHVKMIALVYVGYGIFGGLGLGISYISPVSALQKWFPDRRGVAAGLAVSGFGAGSIVMAKIPDPLAAAVGLPFTFVILGSFYFVVMVVCAFVFRVPPPGYVVNGLDVWAVRVDDYDEDDCFETRTHTEAEIRELAAISMTSRRNSTRCGARTGYDPSMSISLMDAFYSREFRLMYIMFLGNTMAGVVIISRLANIATDIFDHNKDAASTIVSINGGFNLVGRLFFASLSDRIGRKNSYMIMLGSQAIILVCLPTIMQTRCNWAFLMSIWILTSCYGGGFGCIPAFLCDMFGPSNIGPLHGVILTSWSLSSVGAGLLFTAIYNHLLDTGYTVHDSYIYSINMNWILAGVALGLFMALFVRTGIRDRLLPAVPGEFFHSRIFGRILRFGRFGLKWVTKEQEESEWAAYVVKRQLEEEQDHGLSSSPGYHKTIDREEKASR